MKLKLLKFLINLRYDLEYKRWQRFYLQKCYCENYLEGEIKFLSFFIEFIKSLEDKLR